MLFSDREAALVAQILIKLLTPNFARACKFSPVIVNSDRYDQWDRSSSPSFNRREPCIGILARWARGMMGRAALPLRLYHISRPEIKLPFFQEALNALISSVQAGAVASARAAAGVFSTPVPTSGAITRRTPGRTLIRAAPLPRMMPSAATSSLGEVLTFIFRAW